MSRPLPVIAVLLAEGVSRPAHLEPLDGRVEWRFTDREGLGEAVRGASALLLWDFFSSAVADVWQSADRLQWIHVAAAGVDKLLFDDLRESEVTVTNARGVFDRPIAEYVLGGMLADVKLLHESHDLQRERTWVHRETRTLRGTTAMVVGTGSIGREIARLLSGVGVTVLGAGRTARSGDDDFADIVESAALARHVGAVDYLVNAAPLTPSTRGLIGAEVLEALPDHAYLLNIGRGPTVVEADLVDAVRSGRLRGACLDVFEEEPLPKDSPLWDLPGVTVTPHMSGDIVGWRDELARQFVDIARQWLDGRPMRNVVDKKLGFVPR